MRSIDAGVVDGLLLISRFPAKILGALAGKIPMAMINNNWGGMLDVPSICCDYHKAGYIAVEHFIKKGHRRIAYLTDKILPEVHMHLSGMNCALEAHGLAPLENDAVIMCSANYMTTQGNVNRCMDEVKPTAIFARQDMFAARAMRFLTKMGLEVPKDVSILGQGDYSWAGQPEIALSTIDNQLPAACQMGLDLMRKLCNGEDDYEMVTSLAPRIIERDSVVSI